MSDKPRKITSLQRVKPYKDPKGRNPYRGKPIPKGRIEWAIENSLSLKGAARVLGVSYNTLKKYAKRYDLFEQNINIGGKGVPKTGNLSKYRYKIEDIFACKHPEMPHYKIQEILIRGGLMVQKCMRCGHDETRDYDQYGPFILDFIDNDGGNHKQENLRLLCYNCFFIVKPVGKMRGRRVPTDVLAIRRKMWRVFNQSDKDKDIDEKMIQEWEKENMFQVDYSGSKEQPLKKEDVSPPISNTSSFGDLSDIDVTLDEIFKLDEE
jgi:hypothetical protein